MSTSLPLPVRVLVKGASTVNWTSWMSGPRTDFVFPRVVEETLLAAGRPCRVEVSTMASEPTSSILSTWQREVVNLSPDVIVLVYGHYETIHLFLPRWLERHANSLRGRPGTLRRVYRKTVVRPVWKLLARLQARLDRTVPPTIRRRRPQRVAADLERYISRVHTVASPLVYVFELIPPTHRFAAWFPGMEARMEVMNATLAELASRYDDTQVRYFRVQRFVDERAGGSRETAIPDGFHYSPLLHRAIGEELGHEILEWTATQPHLRGRAGDGGTSDATGVTNRQSPRGSVAD